MEANTDFKIIRLAGTSSLFIVAAGGGRLYIHQSWLRKDTEPFFHHDLEDTPNNRFLYSSANGHDSFMDRPVPATTFKDLEEIEKWAKLQKK